MASDTKFYAMRAPTDPNAFLVGAQAEGGELVTILIFKRNAGDDDICILIGQGDHDPCEFNFWQARVLRDAITIAIDGQRTPEQVENLKQEVKEENERRKTTSAVAGRGGLNGGQDITKPQGVAREETAEESPPDE